MMIRYFITERQRAVSGSHFQIRKMRIRLHSVFVKRLQIPQALRGLMSGSVKGYLYVTMAAVMWASSGTLGKALFEGGMLPLNLVQIRVTFASVLLAVLFRRFLQIIVAHPTSRHWLLFGIGRSLHDARAIHVFLCHKQNPGRCGHTSAISCTDFRSRFFHAFLGRETHASQVRGFILGHCRIVFGGGRLQS